MKYKVDNIEDVPYLTAMPCGENKSQWESAGVLQMETLTEIKTHPLTGEAVEEKTQRPVRVNGQVQFIAGVFDEGELPVLNQEGAYMKILNAAGDALIDTPPEKLEAAAQGNRRAQAHIATEQSKRYLVQTDYVILKMAEGVLTREQAEQQYPGVLAKRTAARAVINEEESFLLG